MSVAVISKLAHEASIACYKNSCIHPKQWIQPCRKNVFSRLRGTFCFSLDKRILNDFSPAFPFVLLLLAVRCSRLSFKVLGDSALNRTTYTLYG